MATPSPPVSWQQLQSPPRIVLLPAPSFRPNRPPALKRSAAACLSVLAARKRNRSVARRAESGEKAALLARLEALEEERKALRARLEAASSRSAEQGTFHFPTVELPRQLEHFRVVAPGEAKGSEACGDWLSLFRNAAPYIASYRGGVVVVHVPSSLLEDAQHENFKGIMEDVAFCSLLGLRMILVTSVETRVLRRMPALQGDASVVVGNSLPAVVIDERALQIAKQEAGFARVEVEGALSAGFEKRSLSSTGKASAGIFSSLHSTVSVVSSTSFFTASPMGVREGVDFGYAGVVRSVNTELLRRHLGEGDIVSLTPLGTSPNGEVFFVSSEELAARVARKVGALKLVYITHGQRLVDVRHGRVVPGLQHHDARALYERLSEGEGKEEWFADFLRYLKLLVGAVSPKGVRRGHLVEPAPGALLQEFYTTDGSGTCVAQDLYQGLGRAKLADVSCILALLKEDWEVPSAKAVEAACGGGEFFVWKRDEAILGCAQLKAHPGRVLVAELRCFALSSEQLFRTHAAALFGYAERAAVEGGASLLVWAERTDPERGSWLADRGFREATEEERAALPESCRGGPHLRVKPLDASAAQEARECLEAFTEEQRMWGGAV